MTEAAYEPFGTKVRPLKAMAALRRFLRCKEATHEVFRLISALDGPVAERKFKAFKASPVGERVLSEKSDLSAALANRRALSSLPVGSLGRDYLEFTLREGLSPEGFQKEMDESGENFTRAGEDRQRYIYRVRHTHDLFHVLTGYGRDFIGELSLLAFTRQHSHSRALILLILGGYLKSRRDYPGIPIWSCIREGAKLGKASGDMFNADWETLLTKPTGLVRQTLNIGVPRRYLAIQNAADTLDRRYREELSAARLAALVEKAA